MSVVITMDQGIGEQIVGVAETHSDAWDIVMRVWEDGHNPTDYTGYHPGRTIGVRPVKATDDLTGFRVVETKKKK
jgi:hypothetical protein